MARELISEGPVLLSLDEGVAHLRLNRPEAANGMSVELLRALYEANDFARTSLECPSTPLIGAGGRRCGASDASPRPPKPMHDFARKARLLRK